MTLDAKFYYKLNAQFLFFVILTKDVKKVRLELIEFVIDAFAFENDPFLPPLMFSKSSLSCF